MDVGGSRRQPPAALRGAATRASSDRALSNDPARRLEETWEGALDRLAADLDAERAAAVIDSRLLLAKLDEATTSGWPVEVIGYWVAAARRAGLGWTEVAAALGMARQTAQRRFEPWVERFSRSGSRRAGALRAPLPVAATGFIGRSAEMADLGLLLRGARLVTLCGAPGVGKTRLALELATERSRASFDVAWVSLSRVADPGLVTTGVVTALGLQEQPGMELLATVVAHLRSACLLVVFDNCEHVTDECARLVAALLEACPNLTVLATSRELLGVAGEKAWPVPALSLPPADAGDVQQLAGVEAVQLFTQRAVEAQPGFELTAEVIPVVAGICRSLDGIALAIELAAARVAVLSPAEIAARLGHRSGLLGPARPTALSPHESLRAALDWSHDLLTPAEQAILRRLAVFNGGCTLAAAESVCAGDDIEPPQVFDLLAGLVAKSLVEADTGSPETRYRMLDTIRRYAGELLATAGEADQFAAAQARWCVALAEEAEPQLTGPDQAMWLERLDRDHDNLRAALSLLTAAGSGELALRLAASLTVFWRVRGCFSEGRGWLEAVRPASAGAPLRLQAKVLWGTGFLAVMVGDNQGALSGLEEAFDLYRQDGDVSGQARTLLLLGCSLRSVAGSATGLGVLKEAVALARRSGDAWCLALGLAMCGWTCLHLSDFAAARAPLQGSLDAAGQVNDRLGLVLALNGLGYLALAEGDYRQAEERLSEACSLSRSLGDTYDTATALTYLGAVALGRGDYGAAQEQLVEALDLARASALTPADPLWYMGQLALARADPEAATTIFSEHLAITTSIGAARGYGLWGIGVAAAFRGATQEARAHLNQALAGGRARGDKALTARALYDLGRLAHAEADDVGAATCHHEALQLRADVVDLPGVADSLEAVAVLGVRQGRAHSAARLFGAASALRDVNCFARWPAHQEVYDVSVAAARADLSDTEFEGAWLDGVALPVTEAVAYARRGRGPRSKETTGWASLSQAERDVAAQVAQGLSNPEIAERLLMARATVKAHLRHAFAKLGIASRHQLALEASRHGENGQSQK